jgi:cytochrome b561
MRDSRQKFSTATVGLHWIVAIAILGQWPLGYYMAKVRDYSLWPIHQSIGYLLFVVIAIRLIWRFQNGWPQPVSVYSRFEQVLARTVHWTLVVALVVMPVSGIVSTYAGGYDITVFGLTLIPDVPNHAIVAADAIHKLKVIPRSEALHDFLQQVHIAFAWILAGAIGLHVCGALKHHLIDKDGTLRRMLGATVN